MKTVAAYYRHARSLGAFRAIDAIAIARQAAELDVRAYLKTHVPYVEVWAEDGCRLSRAIRVF